MVMTSAQIYNAVRQQGLISSVWEDMELVLSLVGPTLFFVGDPPKTIRDCETRYCLSLGYSAQNFAANRRTDQFTRTSTGVRGSVVDADLAPASFLLAERYRSMAGNSNMNISDIEKLLLKTAKKHAMVLAKAKDLKTNRGSESEEGSEDEEVMTPNVARFYRARRRWGRVAQRSTLDLLLQVRHILDAEMRTVNFDWFRMHRVCWYVTFKLM